MVLYVIGVIFIVLGDSLYIVGNNFIKIRNQIFWESWLFDGISGVIMGI